MFDYCIMLDDRFYEDVYGQNGDSATLADAIAEAAWRQKNEPERGMPRILLSVQNAVGGSYQLVLSADGRSVLRVVENGVETMPYQPAPDPDSLTGQGRC